MGQWKIPMNYSLGVYDDFFFLVIGLFTLTLEGQNLYILPTMLFL